MGSSASVLNTSPKTGESKTRESKTVESKTSESKTIESKTSESKTVGNAKTNSVKQYTPRHVVQIGCGVVGYAYVGAYKSAGCKVTGLEASRALIDKLKKDMDIYHIDDQDDIESIKDVDFIMISICTPLKGDELDLTYLFNSIPNVATILKSSPNALVVIRSTVPPFTTQKYKEQLSKLVTTVPKVLFQPEYLRAATALEDALNPWLIVLGSDKDVDTTNLLELYSRFVSIDKIRVIGIEDAEMQKMFHNSYNAAKISWFNQCKLLIDAINKKHGSDIDIDCITSTMVQTCEGLRNPKYGTKTGHAYYGFCLPKDSAQLAKLEKINGLSVPIFDDVVRVNNEIKKTDTKEILVGDHHMPFSKF